MQEIKATNDQKKPKIEKVLSIHQDFALNSIQAMSVGSACKWLEGMEKYKKAMEEIGLAEHIDWTE